MPILELAQLLFVPNLKQKNLWSHKQDEKLYSIFFEGRDYIPRIQNTLSNRKYIKDAVE